MAGGGDGLLAGGDDVAGARSHHVHSLLLMIQF